MGQPLSFRSHFPPMTPRDEAEVASPGARINGPHKLLSACAYALTGDVFAEEPMCIFQPKALAVPA